MLKKLAVQLFSGEAFQSDGLIWDEGHLNFSKKYFFMWKNEETEDMDRFQLYSPLRCFGQNEQENTSLWQNC